MTLPQTSSLSAHRAPPHEDDALELQAWLELLSDEQLGFWRAISVAGECFLVESGHKWLKRSLIAWISISALPMIGGAVYALTSSDSWGAALGFVVSIGIVVIELLIFVLCTILWPKLMSRARTLRRPPHIHELPMRREALALLKQRQYRVSLSVRRAFKQGFGPGVVAIAPLAFSVNALWMIVVVFNNGFNPLILLLSLLGSVISFGGFLIIGLLVFGGGGLLVVSGQQALANRESVRVRRVLEGPESVGALALAQEHPDDAGALSLSPQAGQITQAELDDK